MALQEMLYVIFAKLKPAEKLCDAKKETLVSDARYLCHEYIEDRLIRSGLHLKPRKTFSSSDKKTDEDSRKNEFSSLDDILETLSEKRSNSFEITVLDMQKVLMYVGECLEMRHINVYTDVMSQTNIRNLKESNLRRAHSIVAQELFSGGISWCKIISLFAFAGALSVDCVLNGSSIYVRKIENWTVEFVENRLTDWIYCQGGWVGMFDHFLYKCASIPTPYTHDKRKILLVSSLVILPLLFILTYIVFRCLKYV